MSSKTCPKVTKTNAFNCRHESNSQNHRLTQNINYTAELNVNRKIFVKEKKNKLNIII